MSESPEVVPGRSGGPAWIWAAAAVMLVAMTAVAVARRPANHDSAWYLHMAGVWLDGGVPYRDAVDTNPPLILLLTVPPVWAARATGVSSIGMFEAFVFVLALLSAAACLRGISRAWPAASPAWRSLIAVAVLFLVGPFPKGDFGQREHFALILTLPYVLLGATRAAGRPVGNTGATLIGMAGAAGFALKPHFLLAWVAVEGALLWQARRVAAVFRVESVTVAAAMAAYGLLVVLAFPQYFEVAARVRQVYGGINSPVVRLVGLRELTVGGVALALLVLLRLPRRYRAPQVVVGAAAFGFLAASLLQLKGWSYHMLPAQAYLALFLVVTLASVMESAPALVGLIRGGVRGIAVTLVVGLTALSVKYAYEAGHARAVDLVSPLARVVREHADGGTIAVLSMRTLIYPAFPLVNVTGVNWSMRHNALWFLPGFYERELQESAPELSFRAPGAMSALEHAYFDEVVTDLCAHPPDLLVVELPAHNAPAGRRALDLIAYYGQSERFARLRAVYRQVAAVPPFVALAPASQPSCAVSRGGPPAAVR